MDNSIANNKKDSDSKKIFTTLILIATLMVCTTSATYAFFALSATNTNTVTGTASTATLTLTVTQATLKSSNTGVMVPQLASALGTAMNSTNQCVDGNGNVVCKVYTITITNGSSGTVVLNGTIQFDNVTPNLKWKRVATTVSVGASTTGTSYAPVSASTTRTDLISGSACTPASKSDGCTAVSLAKNASATYYIVMWINETGSSQGDSGTWYADVVFEGQNGTGITSTITT